MWNSARQTRKKEPKEGEDFQEEPSLLKGEEEDAEDDINHGDEDTVKEP